MFLYILKRIFIFIPTLIIISLLAFIISVNAPGDPADTLVNAAQDESNQQNSIVEKEKREWRHKLGLDLPLFYFSLSNLATPDTLYKIEDKDERNALERLIAKYGDWKEISDYDVSLKKLFYSHDSILIDSEKIDSAQQNEVKDIITNATFSSKILQTACDENFIQSTFSRLKKWYAQFPVFEKQKIYLSEVEKNYALIKTNSSPWKYYVPAFRFYGNNQYHRWIFGDGNWLTGAGSFFTKGILRGDFGMSYSTHLPVMKIIKQRIPWSLFFVLISIVLAYGVSIPIGVKAGANKGSTFDRTSTVILFILYSMPAFWVATLLLMTFANPDMFAWFPVSGVKPATGIPDGAGFFQWLKLTVPHLILPTIAYTYSSFAFLSRIMRVSMIEIVNQDFIRTAKAKGLSTNAVVWRHGFRNSLIPIITVFANIFPAAVGGSVILETIFSIPGMGSQIYESIQSHDYPMIVAVFSLTGMLTLLGYLISDILYAIVDPRISFSSK